MCGFISSVFKKIIHINTTPTFQEVCGVAQPLIFVDGIRTSHGIALTITKLIDLYSQSVFMPPLLKKLKGHIAFGLSVLVCVRPSMRQLQNTWIPYQKIIDKYFCKSGLSPFVE